MTQEEKAKRYDELLLKLQKAKVDDNVCDERYCCVIDDIVPELAKSEDERIREELISFLKENHETGMAEKTWSLSGLERWIAWLEKQGEQILANSTKTCKDEQKHVDKVEPKFKVGYWVTCKEIDTALIVNITDDKYEVEFIDGNKGFPHIDYVDRIFSLWTIQNAKDGDVLYSPTHHLIWIYKDNEHYYACVNMNYVTENVAIDGLINIPNDACLATKEQRKQLEKAMADAGYTFDFEKKELKKIVAPKFKIGDTMRTLQEAYNGITSGLPVVVSIDNEYYHCNNELIAIKDQDNYEYPPMNRRQKPSWSEEDENLLKASFENLTELKDRYGEDYGKVWKCINWLKSLKQRYTWKPSEEQLDALQYVYRNLNPPLSDKLGWNSLKTLELMYHDLKKLK